MSKKNFKKVGAKIKIVDPGEDRTHNTQIVKVVSSILTWDNNFYLCTSFFKTFVAYFDKLFFFILFSIYPTPFDPK